jgi:hypothetical protein
VPSAALSCPPGRCGPAAAPSSMRAVTCSSKPARLPQPMASHIVPPSCAWHVAAAHMLHACSRPPNAGRAAYKHLCKPGRQAMRTVHGFSGLWFQGT